ncbi:hypothetical protein D477_012590 [Arthrobacter crystallopoietes BAB-32]|uniref:Uncharacterized protein n=1 Tax=Arthrobacter crystallopoietes BAB-32 TaxID=1246476 RepID=N1V1L7_9MICC|nr:hypothetical protein [Arthrobacter crystallopoietes]EMY33884.1 hypothetical protein D477_012590 [Arthrobacter crystallopoietes BAB-32]
MTSQSAGNTPEQHRETPTNRLAGLWRRAVQRTQETGIGVPLAILALIAIFWVALRLANYAQRNAITPVEALIRIYGTGAVVLLTLLIAAASVWTIIERLGYTDKFFCPAKTQAAANDPDMQQLALESARTAASTIAAVRSLPATRGYQPQPAASDNNDGERPTSSSPSPAAATRPQLPQTHPAALANPAATTPAAATPTKLATAASAKPSAAAEPQGPKPAAIQPAAKPANAQPAKAEPAAATAAKPVKARLAVATAAKPAKARLEVATAAKPAKSAKPQGPKPAANPAAPSATKPAQGNLLSKGKGSKAKASKSRGR